MSVIDDLSREIKDYATNRCETKITNFSINGAAGDHNLDIGQTFNFKVTVANSGPLDMKNVTVKVEGSEFADIHPPGAPIEMYQPAIVTPVFDLPAGGRDYEITLKGRARSHTGGSQTIVTARILSWDASLNDILIDKTTTGAREGTLVQSIRER